MLFVVLFLLALIIYHYAVFPLILAVVAFVRPRTYHKADNETTSISFIVAAYNEERVLHQKIRNCLAMEYPSDKMQFIFVLDGSTDQSHAIVKSYERQGILCLHDPQRRGKTAALNRAMKVATGDVVVFSDANSMFDAKAVRYLLRNFSDPSIGGVCGRKGILANEERAASKGDSFYWDIESVIKMLESRINSISTGDGEIFAIRRELFHPIPDNVINDDTAITFTIIHEGLRVVYEPDAITYEEASLTLKDDFNVKVRMVAGGYQTLQLYTKKLFLKAPFFCAQFFSHKVLRWLMPVLLILLLVSNLFVLDHWFFQGLLLLQLLFYSSAALGAVTNWKSLYLPRYYVLMNIAALAGLYKFFRQDLGVKIWKKAER